MTFLNPLVLVGLGAAAIPIIIHLLNLRKVRTIEFSTLSFLKELQRTEIRKIKLRQLLLLIVRTLLIVFIVLAFSRPALQTGGGVLGTDAHTTAAILFDDSPSMTVSNERGNVFRQASELAAEILTLFKPGDNVVLLRQSDLPDATTASPTADIDHINRILHETNPTSIHRPFSTGLLQAHQLMEQSPHLNKELYIISDMQRSHWIDETHTIERVFDEHYRAYVLPIPVNHFENVAVHTVTFRSTLFEVGKPITMDVEIRNYAENDVHNHLVSVSLMGNRVAQKAIDIPAGGSVITDFTIIPPQAGFLEGYVELDDDILPIDNRYYFTIAIPTQLSVLLVAPSRDDIRFVQTALAARSQQGETSAIRTTYVPAANLATEDLSEYDCIIAVNVPSFSDLQADRIVRFVEQGGGLILFPGNDIDIGNYNRGILPKLQLPEITSLRTPPNTDTGALLFDRIDYDHPIFLDIFEERIRERAAEADRIESPRMYQSIVTRQPRTADSQIITLTGNQPFLIGGRRGNGTVLFYSVHPGMQWSDFPVRGIFVPLIHRSVLYSSAIDHHNNRFVAGDDAMIMVSAAGGTVEAEYLLIHPDGMEERIQPTHLAAAGAFQFTLTSIPVPGIYRISRNNETVTSFAVNVSHYESKGDRISSEEIKETLREYGLRQIYIIDADDDLAATVHESRFGRELWKMFALLALIAALAEMIIARDSRQTETEDYKLSSR